MPRAVSCARTRSHATTRSKRSPRKRAATVSRPAEAAPAGSDAMPRGPSDRVIASVLLVVLAVPPGAAAQDTVRVTTDTDLDGDRVDATGAAVPDDPPPDQGWALERF